MLLEEEKKQKKPEKTATKKKYIALETVKITCNKDFDLVKGEEISKDIHKAFIESLINSKLIKEV